MNKQIRKNLILLKDKSKSDKEYDAVKNHQDEIHYVPVISYQSVNLEELRIHLTGRLSDIAGIIITSQRAVHSLLELVKRLQDEYQDMDDKGFSGGTATSRSFLAVRSLLKKPFFVVGPTTGKLLADGGFLDIRGAGDNSKVGNAKDLVEVIIADRDAQLTKLPQIDQGSSSTKFVGRKHLLFLTGEIRKDIIPEMLGEHKFKFVEKVIYKTKPENPKDTLYRMNQIIKDTSCTGLKDFLYCNWVVFYSSQGVSSIVQKLLLDTNIKHSNSNESKNENIQDNKRKVKVASIGPSTGKYLMDQGIVPDVIALRPTAAKLFEEIELHHLNNGE